MKAIFFIKFGCDRIINSKWIFLILYTLKYLLSDITQLLVSCILTTE